MKKEKKEAEALFPRATTGGRGSLAGPALEVWAAGVRIRAPA